MGRGGSAVELGRGTFFWRAHIRAGGIALGEGWGPSRVRKRGSVEPGLGREKRKVGSGGTGGEGGGGVWSKG